MLQESFLFSPQTVQVPVYSEQEYQMYLHDDAWTKAETDHLFDLARRFDLRFVVIHDRYDHQQFKVSPGGQVAASNLLLWRVQDFLHLKDQITPYINLIRGK